ncbi:MAG: hypothetical protein IJ091_10980 [Oscillospiraceae bacterium]|nr:hypothetical protein [Oscillospiraceae bacterium]
MDYNIDELLQELKEKREEIEKDKVESEKKLEDALKVQPETDLGVTAILDTLKNGIEPNNDVKEVSASIVETKQIDFSYNKAEKIKEIVEKRVADAEEAAYSSDGEIDKSKKSDVVKPFEALLGDYSGDFRLGHPDEAEISPENISRAETEKHPLFTAQQTTVRITIPEVKPDVQETIDNEEKSSQVLLGSESDRSSSRTLLNASEEDDFSEFFGDNVVVEHGDTKTRPRKVEVVSEEETKFESDASQPSDAYEILSQNHGKKGRSVIIIGVSAFLLLFFNVLLEVFHIPVFSAPKAFYGLTLVLIILAAAADISGFWDNIKNLFKLRFKPGSLISFSLLLSAIDDIVSFFDAYSVDISSIALVSVLGYFFYEFGLFLDTKRLFDSIKMISEMPQKYASLVLADSDFTHALTHDLNVTRANVLIKRKTSVVDNFLSQAFSKTVNYNKSEKVQPFAALLSLLLGVVFYFMKGRNLPSAIRTIAAAAALVTPFISTLINVLPIKRLQNTLNKVGAVIPGYSAAEDIANANCVVIEGRELFPREKVLLHGIKTFEKERVDQAILYAASVLIHSCDTMSYMFMKVIQGKTDMLFDTDSVVYEEGLGFSFWVDKSRILVGRRELLEAHEIEVPSRDYENRYTKTSTRDAIYLAVAGKLYAMFVISYAPDEEMQSMLQELVKNNVNIIVRTRDFIISADKIARMYDIPRSMVSLVRESTMPELAKKTDYTRSSSSSLTHGGSVSALLKGIIGSHRVLKNVEFASMLELVCIVLGALIALILTLTGAIATTSAMTILVFQLAWALITFILLLLKKE